MSFAADKISHASDAPPASFVFSAGNASENPPAPSPGGNQTWTFVFTDIAQSSVLWRTQPDAMETALAWHDALLTNAAQEHHGVVFKRVGDGAYLAFPNAGDALRMACDVQTALHARFGESGTHPLPLRVRIALHSGAAQTRNDDFFGLPLSQIARLLAILHGGQIVCTQATAALAQHSLAPGVTLRELGAHPLRDFDKPEPLFQAVRGDFPHVSQKLRAEQAAPPHNLPRQLSSFIGREKEVGLLKRLISVNALVTLTGAGGSGKTRLALRTAEILAGDFEHGTFFVDLSPLTDAALIAPAVAQAVGAAEVAGQSTHDALLAFLQTRSVLLLLDNCEHLIDGCARFADAVLRACPNVHILATSRESLGIWGEAVSPVPPLGVPPIQGRPVSLQKLHTFEAVHLFVERAQSQNPTFQITTGDAPHIVRLCHFLDGIPLALEIAASRAGVLSPAQIAERLGDLVKLLKAENTRLAVPRQKTLRAVIDWSYNLLSPSEQTLLRRLSVFAGGWTLEAAEAVCSDAADDFDVSDGLIGLAKKSLIVVDFQAGKKTGASSQTILPNRMLETIRQYAQEALVVSGEAERAAQKHQAFFADFAQSAEPHLRGSDQKAWLDKIEADHDNFRAALGLTSENDAPVRIAVGIFWFWYVRGFVSEGRSWLDKILAAQKGNDKLLRARAQRAAGILAQKDGDVEAVKPHLTRALDSFERLGNSSDAASVQANLGIFYCRQDQWSEAETYLTQSLNYYRDQNDTDRQAVVLLNLGVAAMHQNKTEAAVNAFVESLAIFRQKNDLFTISQCLHNLGRVRRLRGEWDTALENLRECLRLKNDMDEHDVAGALLELGLTACAQERFFDAARCLAKMEAVQSDPRTPPLIDSFVWEAALVQAVETNVPAALLTRLKQEAAALPLMYFVENGVQNAPFEDFSSYIGVVKQ